MKVLKAIEVNEKPLGVYWACYVWRKVGETEYGDSDSGLFRENCVEPNQNKFDVIREARRQAEARSVPFINLIDLNANVPFVEVLAKMEKK